MEQKLSNAIAYLRSRNKYLIDATCTFKPTRAAELREHPRDAQERTDGTTLPLVQSCVLETQTVSVCRTPASHQNNQRRTA
jgi:hypothetical protein